MDTRSHAENLSYPVTAWVAAADVRDRPDWPKNPRNYTVYAYGNTKDAVDADIARVTALDGYVQAGDWEYIRQPKLGGASGEGAGRGRDAPAA